MNSWTIIRIVLISIVFTSALVYGVKAAAQREAGGAPPISELHLGQ